MIYLSTGITPNYVQRATRFLESLKSFPEINSLVFAVNFSSTTTEVGGVKAVPCDYSRMPHQLPKWMLQTGAFTMYVPKEWKDDDVIIFVDSDAYFQRPFTADELAAFSSVAPGELLADYNCPNHYQTLLSEAGDLFTKKPMSRIEELLPGMGGYECYNWGFVVARLSTWRELMERTTALWPTVDACFDNPARVQLACIYAANQPGMKISRLPLGCHAHGHHGVQTGLTKDNDVWRLNGEVVAFAHAL